MLEYLRIRNLALIEDMELEFAPGLNALTGETGAGKTFILKALNFLTGDKLETDLIRPGEDKATAEALFSLPEGDAVLRRELFADTGRSRLYVNDSLSSQEAVRALKPSLLIHAGQHGQQRLLLPAYQAGLLDAFLDDETPILEKNRLLRELRATATKRRDLEERSKSLREKRDFLEFQRAEIRKVDPQPGEEESLEIRRSEMRDQTLAQEAIGEALALLRGQDAGLLETLPRLTRRLEAVSRILPDYAADRESFDDALLRLQDLEARLRRQQVFAPGEERLEAIEARLYQLAQLKRKLKRTLDEILSLGREVEENISFLDRCGLDLSSLAREETRLAAELAETLSRLNQARRVAAEKLTAALRQELAGLGFSEHVRIIAEFTGQEIHPATESAPACVEDRVRFLWQPNPGQAPQPLDKIASGGELSRFLLAVTGLEARAGQPTLLFDEVDAGVGGVTLTRLGERLQALSKRQQVLVITHWPQLACLAERHFLVRKEVRDAQTYTLCDRLAAHDIFAELSRMSGGGDQGAAMAEKLLKK